MPEGSFNVRVFMNKIKKARLIINTTSYMSEIIQIIIGTFIMSCGTVFFLLPNQLSSGGFSGIATITFYFFKFPMGTTILILNIPLFFISLFKNGGKFLAKAIIGTALLSVFIDFLERFNPLTSDRFLACIYGGILTGIGTAIILKANASTGGSDLLANIIKKFKPTARTSNLIVIIDTIIVGLNVVFFKELEIGLYSAIAIYIMGKIIDIFFEGIYFTKMMWIVSDKYVDISKKINSEIGRGTTALYGKGMYKGEEKNVLLCVASRSEIVYIRQIIKKIDSRAFIIISNAREVIGNGFKRE